MTAVAVAIVWCTVFLLGYVYIGYPVLLWFITRWHCRAIRPADIAPTVTLLISAFNEARVIASKLENALALDYPKERINILVISDASTDETDAIVESFVDRGVQLLRMPERQGKTVGLNAAVQRARGEIIVFSDANIMYEPMVIKRLVRNFADPDVGCVTGDSRYTEDRSSAAHLQENTYWHYEQKIRAMESKLGSTVGGDGAIFAIRKVLYRPLSRDAINDLVIPLQIVARGCRAIFEPAAVGFEPTAGDFAGEFRRKRRIVNRSWRGVRSVPEVLSPWAVGIFAWQVWSHKVLRWLVLPMVLIVGGGCFFAISEGPIYRLGALGFIGSIVVAAGGALAKDNLSRLARLAHGLFYFYMVNLAAFLGILMAVAGKVEVVWTPERR